MTSNAAAAERALICDLFLEVGPDAPTLSGDWTTRDLAAHMVIRERRPDAAIGIVSSVLSRYSERVRVEEAERPYEEIVERLRGGPPIWSPTRVGAVDALANTIEFFVHHEDVRRAQQPWSVRPMDAPLADALGRMLRGPMFKLMTRRSPVGIAVEPEGREGARLKEGEPMVTIAGPVGEIVLFLYGRGAVAQVELDGPADAIAQLRRTPFGL
jgi:uncharacterized protein (TIGR03085 family)